MGHRYQREKEFHDTIFSQRRRKKLDKYYSVVRSSRSFYEQSLEAACEGNKVLEYGSGQGGYPFFLCEHGAWVVGIDISTVALAEGMQKRKEGRFRDVSFCAMNGESLGFADSSFDLVCGTSILHHLDLESALRELTRVLKPGGSAVFIEPLGHNPLINLYRRVTPHLRSADEHPLRLSDLKAAEKHFGRVELHYFHLLSLGAVPFRRLSVFEGLLDLFDRTDRRLFRWLPFVRRYAWQVVMVLADPQKATALPIGMR
jgi:ubiquinone/menaquinone biosynthesis C-methylase UbiE